MSGQAAPSSAPSPQATAPSAAPAEGRTIVERPPPGLGRGRFESASWLVVLLGGLALAVTLAFYLRRLRRRQS